MFKQDLEKAEGVKDYIWLFLSHFELIFFFLEMNTEYMGNSELPGVISRC